PRIGKYGADGKPRAMPGHHIPMALLGTFILLFGWFGFNAASTLAASDVRFAVVATNTAIAGAFGASIGMLWIMMRSGKPDPGMMANGMLAGLVAITAPCAFVQPWAAAVIGSIAAVLIIESIGWWERRGVDDPVGAISVHGVGGLFGVLCVGIFADGQYGGGWNLTTGSTISQAYAAGEPNTGVTGILYDASNGFQQLVCQLIGMATIVFVIGGIAFAFFKIQNALTKGGIRIPEAEELAGADIEMGVVAYPEFDLVEEEPVMTSL
ncbi:MAG: ammonium transporter, partial [Actinobacteria bacterium]